MRACEKIDELAEALEIRVPWPSLRLTSAQSDPVATSMSPGRVARAPMTLRNSLTWVSAGGLGALNSQSVSTPIEADRRLPVPGARGYPRRKPGCPASAACTLRRT